MRIKQFQSINQDALYLLQSRMLTQHQQDTRETIFKPFQIHVSVIHQNPWIHLIPVPFRAKHYYCSH